MADLMRGGAVPAASDQQALSSPRRPYAAPAPTSSPSGIKGPRMIMQERAAREAARRAEQEQIQQMERDRAEQDRIEQEARLLDEARQRMINRQAGTTAAGVVAGQGNGNESQQRVDPHRQGQYPAETSPSTRQPATSQAPTHQQRPSRSAPAQQVPPEAYSGQTAPQQQPSQVTQGGGETTGQTVTSLKPRNTFPHAFERWETLSAHWEGLTSYWLRKLDQNKDDINRDPLSQQLSRQVTDLSAAGANLFHAVVELQRLRASSERKFQRWFFETRAELERSHELNAMLESALEKERQSRSDAIQDAVEREQGTSKAQKQLAEMRKELAISKEEARRAWEELGRREQEERDRTLSLQSGQPTIVGGVQVVPMTQVARQGTMREQAPYQADYGQGYRTELPPGSMPGTMTSAPEGAYYQQAEHSQPQTAGYTASAPEGAYTEEEYKTPTTTNPPSSGYEPTASTAAGQWTGAYSESQDYSGEGYAAPGWETMPRHHHPTRLSDVIEEDDERSRTSTSQVSRG